MRVSLGSAELPASCHHLTLAFGGPLTWSNTSRPSCRPGALLLAVCVLFQGCGAGWHQPAEVGPAEFKPRQQVQVWRGATAHRWHGVIVASDTISGVPFQEPLDCDSCRIAFPRASVDSIRFGNPVAGFWKSVGLAVGIMMVPVALMCAEGMCSDDY